VTTLPQPSRGLEQLLEGFGIHGCGGLSTDEAWSLREKVRRWHRYVNGAHPLLRESGPSAGRAYGHLTNGELLALSGQRSPYGGKLVVVEEGALADLLVVDGSPIANIRLIEDPECNLRVIMKDGRIYKNSLQ